MTADPQTKPSDDADAPASDPDDDGSSGEPTSGVASDEGRAAPRRSGKKKKAVHGKTPGERLAAAKAARAARKAKERGRDAEAIENEALKRAGQATDWVAEHRTAILGGLGVAAAAVVGFLLWNAKETTGQAEASQALWAAVEAADAPIADDDGAGGEDPETGSEDPVATSLVERAEAAAAKYQTVLDGHPGSDAATWAQLGLGAELLTAGRAEEARAAFGAALQIAGDDVFIEFRALEGIGFAYETEEKWDEAIDHFEQLRAVGDPSFEDIADYHLARMNLRKGDTERAKELLAGLLARRDSEREDDPELSFLENQARLRLTEIDPSFSSRSAPDLSSTLGNLDSLPPEVRELLRKQGAGP